MGEGVWTTSGKYANGFSISRNTDGSRIVMRVWPQNDDFPDTGEWNWEAYIPGNSIDLTKFRMLGSGTAKNQTEAKAMALAHGVF